MAAWRVAQLQPQPYGQWSRNLGSIKGDVKKKHFSIFPGRFFSDIQPLLCGVLVDLVPEGRSGCGFIYGCVVPCELFAPASSGLANGQPWFYLRLATKRGTIALLGCPREHMVPRETLTPKPGVDTYPRTRALSDRRTPQPK